jgi:peptidylprolyl isomerase
MKTASLLSLTLAMALPLSAQTPAPKPVVHHYVPACAKLPELSPKIPALPAGVADCAKPLYTLTSTPTTKLDYASPLLSPEVKEALAAKPTTFSLLYIDTKVGTGEAAKPGKFYTVHYTGYLTDGTKFDSSVDRGEPISFPYGQHRVIPGWDTGFEGMKMGGKRRLFIPYQLAYGEAGHPPVIPAKSTLVFDVELISQSDKAPEPKTPPAPKTPPPPPPGSAKPAPSPAAKPATPPPADKPATPPPTKQ